MIVEHIKDGRQHFHVMWNRVNLDTGRPIWPGQHWNKSRQAAREMETELGLRQTVPRRMQRRSARPRRPARNFKHPPVRRMFELAWRSMMPPLRGMRTYAVRPTPIYVHIPAPVRRRHHRYEGSEHHHWKPQFSRPIGMSREELIAWAWENGRADILAQFGIFVDFDA